MWDKRTSVRLSPSPLPQSACMSQTPSRSWRAILSTATDKIEKPIELLIKACGLSSIVLVAAIFSKELANSSGSLAPTRVTRM